MKQPSTRSLDDFPAIDDLVRLCKSLAMLDAILSPDWDSRYYSFNSAWAPGEMMASMRNGSGDEYFIFFCADGVAIKGFDHESPMSPWRVDPPRLWPALYESLPEVFSSFRNEPAFSMSDATFCIWRKTVDARWQTAAIEYPEGADPEGSNWMLRILNGVPEMYQEYASEYFEVDLPLSAIKQIYSHCVLTEELLRELNPEAQLEQVELDAIEIGYPSADI